MTLTLSQARIMGNLFNGREASAHVRGRSQTGGFDQSLRSLIKKEFIDPKDKTLTDHGRKAWCRYLGISEDTPLKQKVE